jgi:hypothetical protein
MTVREDPVARATALLPLLARAGDRAAAARILAPLSPAQVHAVVFTLAVSADREPPRPGDHARDGHAAYKRLRSRGIERAEMPAWVVAGEREYMRAAQERKVERRRVRDLHAAYVRLRSHGVPHAEIPPEVRDGENAYQVASRRARRVKAAGMPAGATLASVSLRTPSEGHGKGPGSPEGAPSLSGPQEDAA